MNFAPMVVNILGFKVNTMDRSATLSLGPIQQVDFYQSNKRNQGFGEQNGDLDVYNFPINNVADMDVLDNPSSKGSLV
ncbi:hypothetical protein WD019_11095 [Fictibacillus sp. Mic-4]|uniref:hypothetical protein n=1 Tax=Fictibacillus TaxID=1329200 RepID=UPI0004223604|nr:hypothetical protein [Fictibacillus gelatini]